MFVLGDVESTEPTKNLMRIAEYIDTSEHREELRKWIVECKRDVLDLLAAEVARVSQMKERAAKVELGRCVFVSKHKICLHKHMYL